MGSDESHKLSLGSIQEHDEFATTCHSCSALLQGVCVCIVLSLEGKQWRFMSLSVTWACGHVLNEMQPKSDGGSAACGIFFPALCLERGKFLAREAPS